MHFVSSHLPSTLRDRRNFPEISQSSPCTLARRGKETHTPNVTGQSEETKGRKPADNGNPMENTLVGSGEKEPSPTPLSSMSLPLQIYCWVREEQPFYCCGVRSPARLAYHVTSSPAAECNAQRVQELAHMNCDVEAPCPGVFRPVSMPRMQMLSVRSLRLFLPCDVGSVFPRIRR